MNFNFKISYLHIKNVQKQTMIIQILKYIFDFSHQPKKTNRVPVIWKDQQTIIVYRKNTKQKLIKTSGKPITAQVSDVGKEARYMV